uniref:Uncharacterized protein n=1 Tax=Setaria italica TaxID=4555 RepID=K4AHJ3_SETIT
MLTLARLQLRTLPQASFLLWSRLPGNIERGKWAPLHPLPRTKLVRENRAMPVTYHLPHIIIVFVLLLDHLALPHRN